MPTPCSVRRGRQGLDYPNKHLAACGVALKLADALLRRIRGVRRSLPRWPKLTAIGTIADMVDLLDMENRAIVTHGLHGLSEPQQQPRITGAARTGAGW
jgi:single-stranded-DNA-specific exonuclease